MNDIKLKKLMSAERAIVNFYGNKTVKTVDGLYNHMIHSGYPDDHFGYSSFPEFLSAYFQDKITIDRQNAHLDKQYLTDFQQGKSVGSEIIEQIENNIISYLQGKTNVLLSDLESYLRDYGYRYGQIHDFIHIYFADLVTIETLLIDDTKQKIVYLNQVDDNLDLDKLIGLEKTIVNYYGNKKSIALNDLKTHLDHCHYPKDNYGFSSLKVFLKYYFKDVITINNDRISFEQKYIEDTKKSQTIHIIEITNDTIRFKKKNKMNHAIGQSIIKEIEPIILDCVNNDCHDIEEIEKHLQEKGYHYTNIQNIITNYLYDQFNVIDNQIFTNDESLKKIITEIDPFYQVTIPNELSISVLEKGINQMRELFCLLEGKDKPTDTIQLNDFDQCLIKTENPQNLYKYMNQPDIFNQGKKKMSRTNKRTTF